MPNAYTLSCYQQLGIDLDNLGCIMLDVELPQYVSAQLDPKWAYRSADPKLAHAAGYPDEHHVTMLFGLLHNGNAIRSAVDEVLDGWTPPQVLHCVDVGYFSSPLPSEHYKCLWVKPHAPELLDAHQRLSMLPHINTHPTYEPHITLGYVHETFAGYAIERLEHLVLEQQLTVRVSGINYGDRLS